MTPGHALVIPRRAVQRVCDLDSVERARLMEGVVWTQDRLLREALPRSIDFNVAINVGPGARQTMPQLHLHGIARRAGDVPDPRGGVRRVVPKRPQSWRDP